MSNPPAYQYYPADFDEDTASWGVDEVGIYQRLLNYEWVNGWNDNEGLPTDLHRLARIARCSYKKFLKGWTIIEKKFFQNGNGFLINRRLEEQREIQRKYRELQKEKAIKGAKARWNEDARGHSNGDAPSNARKMPLQSSSSKKEEKKEIKKERKEPSAGFPHTPSELFGENLEHAKRLVDDLSLHFKQDLWKWIGACIKKHWRGDAVLYAVEQLWEYRETTKKPWPFLDTVTWKEHQNRNESEHMVEHEKFKQEEKSATKYF